MNEPRYYRLTELGRRLFGVKDGMDGRRMHWAQIPLDWFNDPAVVALPDSQRFAFMGVGFLLIRRGKLLDSAESRQNVRKSVNIRTTPDFALYMAHGLIELEPIAQQSHSLDRREEIEEIEKNPPTPQTPGAIAPPPPAVGPKPSKPGRDTWLTPYGEAWRSRWGAESEPPWGEMGTAFKGGEASLGAAELLARWVRFLSAAQTSQWARPTRFAQGLGEWAANGPPGKPVATLGRKSVGDVAIDSARQAIEAHRARSGK